MAARLAGAGVGAGGKSFTMQTKHVAMALLLIAVAAMGFLAWLLVFLDTSTPPELPVSSGHPAEPGPLAERNAASRSDDASLAKKPVRAPKTAPPAPAPEPAKNAGSAAAKTVVLRLIDTLTGSPVADRDAEIDGRPMRTDAGGRVSVAAGETRRSCGVRVPGYVARSASIASYSASPVSVPLFPTATLKGTVADSTSRPIAGAAAQLILNIGRPTSSRQGYTALPLFWNARTDGAGHFEIAGLPAGVALLAKIRSKDRPDIAWPDPIVLEPGEVRSMAFRASTSGTVRGVVKDQHGRAVAGARLSVLENPGRRWSTSHGPKVTDEDARFSFENVTCGPCVIAVSPKRRGPAEERYPQLRTRFVQDLKGNPVRGAAVESRNEYWRRAHAKSGEQGEFTLGPVPGGTFKIWALRTGRHRTSEEVEVKGGDRDVILKMPPASCITGIAVDAATGKPVACRLEIIPRGRDFTAQWAEAKKDGTFRLPGLGPGTYDVIARAGAMGTEPARFGVRHGLEIGEAVELENVTVRLAKAGTLVLRVKDLRKHTEEDAGGIGSGRHYRCYVERHGRVASSRTTRYGSGAEILVPSGTLNVFLTSNPFTNDAKKKSWKLEKVVDVPPGKTVEVEFTVK